MKNQKFRTHEATNKHKTLESLFNENNFSILPPNQLNKIRGGEGEEGEQETEQEWE